MPTLSAFSDEEDKLVKSSSQSLHNDRSSLSELSSAIFGKRRSFASLSVIINDGIQNFKNRFSFVSNSLTTVSVLGFKVLRTGSKLECSLKKGRSSL